MTRSTATEHAHLVIDGGRSKAHARLVAADGSYRDATGPGLSIFSEPGALPVVAETLIGLIRELGAPSHIDTLVFAANAVHMPNPAAEEVLLRLFAEIGSALGFTTGRVVLASDVVSTHAGALGLAAGTVIAAGTGVIALAVDAEGGARKVDGRGALLGDRGSGYAIGRSALEAVYASDDGSPVDAAAITRAWLARHGSLDAGEGAVYSSASPIALIASFARDVLALAAEGDPLAVSLTRAAADSLAETVGYARRFAGAGTALSWGGGLLGPDSPLLPFFLSAVERQHPDLVITAPIGGALDGATALAQLATPRLQSVSAWHTIERTP